MAHPTPELFRDMVFRPLLVVRPEAVPDELLQIVSEASRLPSSERGRPTLLERVATLRGFGKQLMLRDELCRLHVPSELLWVIANAGHLPWLDEPQRCARAIEAAMIGRVAAGRAAGGGA